MWFNSTFVFDALGNALAESALNFEKDGCLSSRSNALRVLTAGSVSNFIDGITGITGIELLSHAARQACVDSLLLLPMAGRLLHGYAIKTGVRLMRHSFISSFESLRDSVPSGQLPFTPLPLG